MLKRKHLTCCLCVLLGPLSLADADELALFNGRTLDGWTFHPEEEMTFNLDDLVTVEDGVIICQGRADGVLTYAGRFEDYALTLEWRWLPSIAGSSAVFLHGAGGEDAFRHPKSVEVSLFRDNAGDVYHRGFIENLREQDTQDFIFKRAYRWSPEKEMGEWNTLRVICREKTVTVFVNGKAVNQVANYPGRPYGTISLQCGTTPIFFRNIKLERPLAAEHAEAELAAKQQIAKFLAAKRKYEAAEQAAADSEEAAETAKKEAFVDLAVVDVEPEFKFSADAKAIPFPRDARELEFDATFGDIQFKSGSSLNALSAFYRLEMAKRSWKEDVSEATIEDDSIELKFKNGKSELDLDLDERSDYVQVKMDCEELDFTGTNDPAGLVALGIPQPRGVIFLQEEIPLPDAIQDLEYETDECSFKSSMKLQAAFDHFSALIRGKGYRESRRPIVSDDRRYTEFQRGPVELSVNIFTHDVGSRIHIGYDDERPEVVVAPLPETGALTAKSPAGARRSATAALAPSSGKVAVEVATNKGSVKVTHGAETNVFQHVAAYQTRERPDVTHLVFSSRPIPFQKMQALIATKGDFSFSDLYEFDTPKYLGVYMSWEHMGFTFSAPGVGIGMGIDDPTEDTTIEAGRFRGSIKMPVDEIFSRPFSFVATFDAAVITPDTRLGSRVADPVQPSQDPALAGADIPMPAGTEDVSRSGSNYRKTYKATSDLSVDQTMAFYRKELTAQNWEEVVNAESPTGGFDAQLQFRNPTGSIAIQLKKNRGKTAFEIVTRDSAKAKRDGILPEPGKARLVMVNGHTERIVYSIGKIEYPMKPRQGFEDPDKAYNYSIRPNTYTVVIKIPGNRPQTEQIELTAGSTWAIIAAPTGGYAVVQLY